MTKYGIVCYFLLFSHLLYSAIPGTDISLFKIIKGPTALTLEYVKPLVRRKGYDNQPSFSKDSKGVYFTSDNGNNTDIWRVDISNGTKQQVTDTPESEYSPTPVEFNKEEPELLSAVIAFEGNQSLKIIRQGKHDKMINGDVEPIGYHTWISDRHLAVFRLAEPHRLVLLEHNQENDSEVVSSTEIAKDIGRCLVSKNNNDGFFFVQNKGKEKQLKSFSINERTSSIIANLLNGKEDYAWHSAIGFVHSDGEVFFHLDGSKQWQKVTVENGTDLSEISRLAISPNGQWLAVVHKDNAD